MHFISVFFINLVIILDNKNEVIINQFEAK